MRIALLSDIHGNLAALEAVTEDLGRRSVDAVINLGDSLSGPLLPAETAQFLMAQNWFHLSGNHERQILTLAIDKSDPSDAYARSRLTQKELDWIASLRPSHVYSSEILFCHGTPNKDAQYFLETVAHGRARLATPREIQERLGEASAALIACGHTHVPRSVRTAQGQLIVNPGSVGLPAFDDDYPAYHVVENGSPDARYAIVEKHGSGWTTKLIAVPYNHAAMAQLAKQRGRDDWVCALQTGYMSAAA